MVVAERGWPSSWLVLATLIGGTLSAGGANAINCWYDRDIDGVMRRTRSRPLVTGVIEPAHALAFGIGLGAAAFVFLWATTTFAAAALALAALLFYVFVYTIWLKRRTPQNIVIGGAAGAFPPMVGWAAVTGDVSLASTVMFAIIFFWTPPHFWALSLRLKDDYADAGVPMLPVTDGVIETRLQILRYSVLLVVVTLLLWPAAELSWVYLGTALATGAVFVWLAFLLWRRPAEQNPMSLYKYSLLYLAVLFTSMGLDAALL
jgi:protoheme IX farnesyltransferase